MYKQFSVFCAVVNTAPLNASSVGFHAMIQAERFRQLVDRTKSHHFTGHEALQTSENSDSLLGFLSSHPIPNLAQMLIFILTSPRQQIKPMQTTICPRGGSLPHGWLGCLYYDISGEIFWLPQIEKQ